MGRDFHDGDRKTFRIETLTVFGTLFVLREPLDADAQMALLADSGLPLVLLPSVFHHKPDRRLV